MSLRGALSEAAADLPDVDSDPGSDGGVTWSRQGRPFALLGPDGSVAEFRLDPAVAAAAARTPDVVISPRGPAWVRFSPTVLDSHGLDRAVAWFLSAHRHISTE